MANGYPIVILIILYTIFYYKKHVYTPKIYTNNPIIKTLQCRKVYPFYFIPYGFIQTLYQLFRRVSIIKECTTSGMILKVSDDAEVFIDIHEPVRRSTRASEDSADRIGHNVLLIHGLNGTSRSTYIRGMANVFLKKRCRVFCYNARGALHPPKSNLFSHHGLTSDIQFTVEYILANYEGHITLVGFSLGSNWVAKLLGEYSNDRIKMGVSVCCPFDFNFLKSYFKRNYYGRFIAYFMSRNYKRYLRRSMLTPLELTKSKFLDEIDTQLLGIYKKDSLEEFYKENSCISYLDRINRPFLFINAIDDPIIPPEVIPYDVCLRNANIGVAVLKGGHLGFFINRHETMAELVVSEFFDKVCPDAL